MIKQICLLPHGDEVLKTDDQDVKEIRKIMIECGNRHHGETLIVVSPHSIRVPDQISLLYAERICKNSKCYITDRSLADELYNISKSNNLPVIKVNYGTDSGELSSLPLDWGSEIPLSFFLTSKKVLIIGPGRQVKRRELFKFGSFIGKLKNEFSVIISADQAHTHSYNGPYGFSFFAKMYDKIVKKLVKENDLKNLMYLDKEIIERAKPDSFWQLLILAGILSVVNAKPEKVAYTIKNYYSMLAASYIEL
jgi:aromatic ring-opening dioxygenase LigB subunit